MIQPTIILAAVFAVLAASLSMAKPEKPDKPEKAKAEVGAKKIKGPKKNGKGGREFPVMFDIADRSQKHKAKAKKKTR